MRARALFAALAAMFARPDFTAPIGVPVAREAQAEGFISAASAFRVRAAFARFASALGGRAP
jgi:hypothetical protein